MDVLDVSGKASFFLVIFLFFILYSLVCFPFVAWSLHFPRPRLVATLFPLQLFLPSFHLSLFPPSCAKLTHIFLSLMSSSSFMPLSFDRCDSFSSILYDNNQYQPPRLPFPTRPPLSEIINNADIPNLDDDDNHPLLYPISPTPSGISDTYSYQSCAFDDSNLQLVNDHNHVGAGHNVQARPYVCTFDTCDKAFARKSDLARHFKIHTNDRSVSSFVMVNKANAIPEPLPALTAAVVNLSSSDRR